MRKFIQFIKSLKDPCKLCLVRASCYQGVDCPKWSVHVRARRTLRDWWESTAAITLLIFAVFGIISTFVLIILGSIKFYELIF